jgi:methylenetetrahydrofolate reductase (NADPH)
MIRLLSFNLTSGMMPIQNYSSFQRMTSYCRTAVPQHIWDTIQPISENDEAVKAYGVQLSIAMSQELMSKGIRGFHFYTLNLENSVMSVLKALHVEDTTAVRR